MHLIVQTLSFSPKVTISILVIPPSQRSGPFWLIFDGSARRFGLKNLREGCLQSGGSPMVSSSLGGWDREANGTDWCGSFRKPSRKLLTMENI